MRWFSGNSSTNDEGKFEYQEPKLLRVSRIAENDVDQNDSLFKMTVENAIISKSLDIERSRKKEMLDQGKIICYGALIISFNNYKKV